MSENANNDNNVNKVDKENQANNASQTNNANRTNNVNPEPENFKKGFFKKAKMSIFNIEKYPELATEGVPRAISYLVKIVAILVIVVCAGMVYKSNQVVTQGIQYIENEFPDFSYKDGTLKVETENEIRLENPEYVGKIIVDTATEDTEKINQYTNEITEYGNGIVVLKNKLVIKNEAIIGTASYEYSEILSQMGITEFTKQDVINYTKGSLMISLYISLFVTLFIYAFVMYFLNTISYVFMISIFGYLASLIAKVKMRYAAIFNMSVYSITLSTILNMIYVLVNMFVDFEIKYFEVMYMSVAAIYLIASIFMIKSDLIKRQAELIKIVEVQKTVRKELEEQEREKEEEEKDETKDDKKEEKPKEKKKEKENKLGPEPGRSLILGTEQNYE